MSAVAPYLKLTKPSIVLLVVITGLVALAAHGSLFDSPLQSILVCFAISCAAGSANAFNQIWERDIDARMERTRVKRPLPLGLIKTSHAIIFASALGLFSTAYLWLFHNAYAGIISLLTIMYYVLFYTAWLKKAHYYNIVIGGAAGAAAPLIAWAAVEGTISAYAWIMFAIIFMWTPPHFWALALAIREQYEKVEFPMLPVAKGDKRTKVEIYLYTLSLLPLQVLPWYLGETGLTYLVASSLLWGWYMWETHKRLRSESRKDYKILFLFSILYLFVLFGMMGLDAFWGHFFS